MPLVVLHHAPVLPEDEDADTLKGKAREPCRPSQKLFAKTAAVSETMDRSHENPPRNLRKTKQYPWCS